MLITSRTNPKIIAAAALSDKKNRDKAGMYLIEGRKLFCEAVKRGADICEVFVTEKNLLPLSEELSRLTCEIYSVTESVFAKLTQDRSPDGIICTAKMKTEHTACEFTKPFIICDMQDPGNLGTCIRTALALGISPLILAGDCADIYNPKTVRASMGTLFSQSILKLQSHADAIELCHNKGFRVFAAALTDNALPISVSERNAVYAVGNEGHGLPLETINICDGCTVIPMKGNCESLNAAVCASILMWESTKN